MNPIFTSSSVYVLETSSRRAWQNITLGAIVQHNMLLVPLYFLSQPLESYK